VFVFSAPALFVCGGKAFELWCSAGALFVRLTGFFGLRGRRRKNDDDDDDKNAPLKRRIKGFEEEIYM